MSGASGFTLLLLEEGEVLLESAACVKHAQQVREDDALSLSLENAEEAGRLYICSLSLFFEPKSTGSPIQRYCYKDMDAAPQVVAHNSVNLLGFSAAKFQVMKIKRQSSPYRVVASPTQVGLDLIHRELSVKGQSSEHTGEEEVGVVGLIQTLWKSSLAPLRERTAIIDAICQTRIQKPFDMSRLASFRYDAVYGLCCRICVCYDHEEC